MFSTIITNIAHVNPAFHLAVRDSLLVRSGHHPCAGLPQAELVPPVCRLHQEEPIDHALHLKTTAGPSVPLALLDILAAHSYLFRGFGFPQEELHLAGRLIDHREELTFNHTYKNKKG